MSVLLILLAFTLILVGVYVQCSSYYDKNSKFAVTWTTVGFAFMLIMFAARVYFT